MDTLPFFRAHDPRRRPGGRRGRGRRAFADGRPVLDDAAGVPVHRRRSRRGAGPLDYEGWTPHVAIGGTLAIHDVFPDPADGGRPPYEQIFLPALDSGRFTEIGATGCLRAPPPRVPLTRIRVVRRPSEGLPRGDTRSHSMVDRRGLSRT